jgi:predicted RNA-binding Zn-ribbon protein involved in translation (DUF1610 family)
MILRCTKCVKHFEFDEFDGRVRAKVSGAQCPECGYPMSTRGDARAKKPSKYEPVENVK